MCDVKKLKLHVRCKTPQEPSILTVKMRGRMIGICRKCWDKVGNKEWET